MHSADLARKGQMERAGREREKIYNPKLEYVGFFYYTMI